MLTDAVMLQIAQAVARWFEFGGIAVIVTGSLVALGKAEPGGDAGRRYLNRLSDLLFVLARVLNRAAGRPDVLWQQGRNRAT